MKTFEITNIEKGSKIILTNKTTVEKHILHEVSKDPLFKTKEITK